MVSSGSGVPTEVGQDPEFSFLCHQEYSHPVIPSPNPSLRTYCIAQWLIHIQIPKYHEMARRKLLLWVTDS